MPMWRLPPRSWDDVGRLLRADRHRPARTAHRSAQPAVRVLMPPEGRTGSPPRNSHRLRVVRLVRVAVERLGIREVRFTGGEPLLRRGLAGIVARTAELRPRPEISLTTTIGLARTAASAARGRAPPDQRVAGYAAARDVPQARPARPAP